MRDDLRDYVIDAFADPGAILVVDETGDVKKGVHSVGVQRQFTGTAGRIENSQVAVYLTYAAPRGHALIDRAVYLPRSWAEDPDRCAEAGIPPDKRGFATEPTLAAALVARVVAAKVPAAWVAGDEVYGADPRLRAAIRGHGLGYVLAVSANRRVPTAAGPIRVDHLPAHLPSWAWQTHSAGAGSHGQRYYSWAWITLLAEHDADTGAHHLLIRRNDAAGEHAAVAAAADLKAVPSNLDPPLADAEAELKAMLLNGCLRNFLQVGQPECATADTASPTTVALVGDSSAAMWSPAFQSVAGCASDL